MMQRVSLVQLVYGGELDPVCLLNSFGLSSILFSDIFTIDGCSFHLLYTGCSEFLDMTKCGCSMEVYRDGVLQDMMLNLVHQVMLF